MIMPMKVWLWEEDEYMGGSRTRTRTRIGIREDKKNKYECERNDNEEVVRWHRIERYRWGSGENMIADSVRANQSNKRKRAMKVYIRLKDTILHHKTK